MSNSDRELPGGAPPPAPAHGLGAARMPKARLEGFSDGVFAIAITLLVLDLGVGRGADEDLLRALADAWPSYLAYLTSFLTIGMVWLGHHAVIGAITHADRTLLRINLLLLLAVSVLPFPTRLMGDYIQTGRAERVAAVLYGVWLLLIALAMAALWRYVATGRRLLAADVPPADVDRLTRRLEPDLAFYAVAILLSLLVPQAGAALYLLIAIAGVLRAR